jgi:putative signal transducing protein
MAQPSETPFTVPQPNPNEKLVKVFDTEQESEAIVVKGLLESAGIECDLTSISTVQDAFPGLGGVVILVREEDAEPARRILAEFKQAPAADDDETCEIVIATEEPPAKASASAHPDKT